MQFTKESDYALTGLAELVMAGAGAVLTVAEVAAARDLPEAYLARIFRALARAGLLVARRGRGNGYALARAPERIAVREVIEAVEGPDVFKRCLLWREHCEDGDPCPLHHRLKELMPAVRAVLEQTTVADYVAESPHALGQARR